MNYVIKFFILALLTAPFSMYASTTISNAGFLQGNIWYSKDVFFASDKVRIYTILFNGSASDIVGSVEFYDNGLAIDKTSFSIAGNGRVQDLWVDWVAKEGKHIISARIVEVTTKESNGTKQSVILENTETGKSELVIDIDTDDDNVGNTTDTDDDNDTILDVDEVKGGTDPLKKDSDGDGISDPKELELAIIATQKVTTHEATSTGVLGVARETIKTVDDSIPVPFKTGVTLGVRSIETFRLGEGYQFQLYKEAQIKQLAEIKAREEEFIKNPEKKELQSSSDAVFSSAEKPFAYVRLALYTVLQYLFMWNVIFYGILLFILYRIFKWGILWFRNR